MNLLLFDNLLCILGLTPNTEYRFFVMAYNEVGESGRSDVKQARTKGKKNS